MTYLTCKCGWVHFAVTREYAEAALKKFNGFFDTLTERQQQDYYGGRKASITDYETCSRCGAHYSTFRAYRENDCPSGVTLAAIIQEPKP
jgi:hypothetical protein